MYSSLHPILFVFIFISFRLFASPIFLITGDEGLRKKINACGAFDKKKGFQFKERHFDLKELERVNHEILESARQSGKERVLQIECIQKLKLSEFEEEELKKSLDLSKEFELGVLEYYNRWLYSFEKKNLMTPMDKKYTSELLLLKYDLYSLLQSKTKDILLGRTRAEGNLENYEEQITSIYHSLLKGNFEYYNSITPEFRKEILKKITD